MTDPRNPIHPRLPAAAAAMYTPWTQPVRTPAATPTPHSAIRSQQTLIESLRREIEELRARLGRDSSNSSKPPSSDPPWAPPKQRKELSC